MQLMATSSQSTKYNHIYSVWEQNSFFGQNIANNGVWMGERIAKSRLAKMQLSFQSTEAITMDAIIVLLWLCVRTGTIYGYWIPMARAPKIRAKCAI